MCPGKAVLWINFCKSPPLRTSDGFACQLITNDCLFHVDNECIILCVHVINYGCFKSLASVGFKLFS